MSIPAGSPIVSPVGGPHDGPPSIPHEALVKQKQGQAVLLWAVGAFCIFGWEWLLCLPQEYKKVWKQPLKLPSLLYLANRYFGLIQLSFVMTVVNNAWSPTACKHMFYWEPVGALISTILSQMVLGTRVYAIYSKNRIIASLLAAVLLIEIAFGAYAVSTTSPPIFDTLGGPPGSEPPCGAVMGPRAWLITFWSIPLFYDLLTFLLTAWKALQFWKQEINAPLLSVILRDGVLYFFAIFSMNLVNIIIFLTVPETLRSVNLTPTLVFEIVLSCRLLLNLKGTQEKTLVTWKPVKPSSKTQVLSPQDSIFGNKGYQYSPYGGTFELGSANSSQGATGTDTVVHLAKEMETTPAV